MKPSKLVESFQGFTPRKRRSIIAAVVAALGSLGLAFGLLTHEDDGPTGGTGADYVALGDSYSSGTGTTGAKGKCLRSPAAYPALYAQVHSRWSFRFVACSGADTSEIRVKQLDEVTPEARLITLTAGGNDGHSFAAVLAACAAVETPKGCAEALGTADVYREEHLPGALKGLYGDIADKAPDAEVKVLGYPHLFNGGPDEGEECGGAPGPEVRKKLDAFSDRLNKTIRQAAEGAGFEFVPVDFDGHGVCAEEPWVHGLEEEEPLTQAFHPNDAGHVGGYLAALTGEPSPSPSESGTPSPAES